MILRVLGVDESAPDLQSQAIVQQFLSQFTGDEDDVIHKNDFIKTIMTNRELLAILSPFYGII